MGIKTNNLEVTNGNFMLNGVNIFDKIYPVGSIYISVNSTDPKILFGIGTWDLLPDGYALWTTSSGAGQTIPAGLPNITGSLAFVQFMKENSHSGAFSSSSVNDNYNSAYDGNTAHPLVVRFDANNGADVKGIYGNSNTVQPPAYKVYVYRRTA